MEILLHGCCNNLNNRSTYPETLAIMTMVATSSVPASFIAVVAVGPGLGQAL